MRSDFSSCCVSALHLQEAWYICANCCPSNSTVSLNCTCWESSGFVNEFNTFFSTLSNHQLTPTKHTHIQHEFIISLVSDFQSSAWGKLSHRWALWPVVTVSSFCKYPTEMNWKFWRLQMWTRISCNKAKLLLSAIFHWINCEMMQ